RRGLPRGDLDPDHRGQSFLCHVFSLALLLRGSGVRPALGVSFARWPVPCAPPSLRAPHDAVSLAPLPAGLRCSPCSRRVVRSLASALRSSVAPGTAPSCASGGATRLRVCLSTLAGPTAWLLGRTRALPGFRGRRC